MDGTVSILFLITILLTTAAGVSRKEQTAALLLLRSSLGLRQKEWPTNCTAGQVTGINISGFHGTPAGMQNPQFAVDALQNLTQLNSLIATNFSLHKNETLNYCLVDAKNERAISECSAFYNKKDLHFQKTETSESKKEKKNTPLWPIILIGVLLFCLLLLTLWRVWKAFREEARIIHPGDVQLQNINQNRRNVIRLLNGV